MAPLYLDTGGATIFGSKWHQHMLLYMANVWMEVAPLYLVIGGATIFGNCWQQVQLCSGLCGHSDKYSA